MCSAIPCADRSRRVLFVCPVLDAGGAERHWAGLLPALARRGVGVRLVAIGGGGRALEQLRDAGIPVRELGAAGLASLTRMPHLLQEHGGRPGAIVTWGHNAHVLGAAFARTTGVPHVVNWHRPQGIPMPALGDCAVSLVGRSGAGAIAVTRAQLPDLERLRFAPERIRIVPNGVPPPPDLRIARDALRTRLGLPADAVVAVVVARLRAEKRVGDFLAALAALAPGLPGLLGVVVGDGPEEEQLRLRARELRAPVRLVGFQADPSVYMLAADVVCLTSEFEALPMALVEAAACGRPSVTTDVGGTGEIVQDGITGLCVPPRDVPRLTEALAHLAGRADERARMGHNALERWATTFSFEAMADRYCELLTTVSGPPTTWHG